MKAGVKTGGAEASLAAHVLLNLMGIWKPESISWKKIAALCVENLIFFLR